MGSKRCKTMGFFSDQHSPYQQFCYVQAIARHKHNCKQQLQIQLHVQGQAFDSAIKSRAWDNHIVFWNACIWVSSLLLFQGPANGNLVDSRRWLKYRSCCPCKRFFFFVYVFLTPRNGLASCRCYSCVSKSLSSKLTFLKRNKDSKSI